jgi:hypothetical protein
LVAVEGFQPRGVAEVLSLTGPIALSNNDVTDRRPAYHSFPDAPDPVVKLASAMIRTAGPRFRYSFPPFSATVIEMQAR